MSNQRKMATAVIGPSRAEHAAAIASAALSRQAYAELHADQFVANAMDKFVVVNADNQIIERASEAKALLHNADGTVRHEDFLVIQDRIVEVRRRTLNGVMDIMNAGLTFNVALGEQLVGFENLNEFQEASQEMNPNSYDNNDTVFGEIYTPNPITHSSFQVPWRQDGFNYKRSLGMTESVRQVAERLEATLFNGNAGIAVNFNGQVNPLYGYTTHPSRGQGTISDWTNAANIELIIPELVDQIGKMWAEQGGVGNDSVVVYLANDIWTVFQNDYKAAVSGTIMERAMQIAQVKEIKPAEKLAAGQVTLVEMEARTVEMAVASDIITVPHTKTNPMAPQVLTTYAAMVQQIKTDSNNQTGVRHLTQ